MLHVLLTGGGGFLGREIQAALQATSGASVTTAGRTRPPGASRHFELDLEDPQAITAVMRRARPTIIVHAAAIADVAACEREPETARVCNTVASAQIAAVAAELGSSLVFISTDQVFDGSRSWYSETAPIGPVNVYGRTKADAETAVHGALPEATVVRLSLVIGPSRGSRPSASDQVLNALREGRSPTLFTDEYRTPIHVADAAAVIAELAAATPDQRPRLLHLGGPERASRYDLGCSLARAAGLRPAAIQPSTHAEARPFPVRPADVSLDTALLRSWASRPPRGIAEAVRAC